MSEAEQVGKVLEREPPKTSRDAILIAEDDPVSRRILQSWMENWGHRVIAVDDGAKAWDILQEDNPPSLLILDWMMPGIDGLELCRKIRGRRHTYYPYVLLVTAKDGKQDVVRGLEAGADDYLTKPFDPGELRARLQVGKRILELQYDLIQAREEIRFQADHDGLSGLWNRTAIMALLERELHRGARSRISTGVLMIDVDHFKNVNDTHGHLTGDAVLKEVAHRITLAMRSYDFVGRYGGEEFLAVLSNCSQDDLHTVAERIRRSVAEAAICTETANVAITVSIGGVATSNATPDLELLSAADSALYAAKRDGRDRVTIGSVAWSESDECVTPHTNVAT
jgi:two-component system cell cycle response regulator